MSNHLDPDLPERCAAAYGCLPDHRRRMLSVGDPDGLDARSALAYGCPVPDQGERKLLSSLDPDLAARSARAWGAPDPEGIGTARKLLSLGASSRRFAPTGSIATNDQGELRQRFRKDLIRVGRFSHPIEDWTLDVTADRLAKWLANFQKMRANGVDVEVLADHTESGQRSDRIRGYVVDMFTEGDTLFGILEMSGEKGIDLAETVRNVSVEIQDPFTDGSGNDYGEVIAAVAIVEKPIVSGQQPFRRAASMVA